MLTPALDFTTARAISTQCLRWPIQHPMSWSPPILRALRQPLIVSHRRLAGILGSLLVLIGPGCGSDDARSLLLGPVEVLRGRDSAGAVVELETRMGNPTAARVTDVVLGVAEAKVVATQDGQIEFTVDFPAGATITYVGTVQGPGASSSRTIAGTWMQHSAGIFAEDTGTWRAPEALTGS